MVRAVRIINGNRLAELRTAMEPDSRSVPIPKFGSGHRKRAPSFAIHVYSLGARDRSQRRHRRSTKTEVPIAQITRETASMESSHLSVGPISRAVYYSVAPSHGHQGTAHGQPWTIPTLSLPVALVLTRSNEYEASVARTQPPAFKNLQRRLFSIGWHSACCGCTIIGRAPTAVPWVHGPVS